MKQKLLLMVLALGMCSFSGNAQKREHKVESDGFVWFKLDDGEGHYGAEDAHGKILIPLSRMYCDINYEYYNTGVRFFGVKKNCGTDLLDGQAGVCDIFGKEIISPKYDIEKYICIVYATHSESVNGNTGFHVVDYKDNNYPTSFMHIYLDQDSKAYRISSGSRIYISDGTNGTSYPTSSSSSSSRSNYDYVFEFNTCYLANKEVNEIAAFRISKSGVIKVNYCGTPFEFKCTSIEIKEPVLGPSEISFCGSGRDRITIQSTGILYYHVMSTPISESAKKDFNNIMKKVKNKTIFSSPVPVREK